MWRALSSAACLVALAACNRGAKGDSPVPLDRPLAVFATQRLVVTPTSGVRVADSLGWVDKLGGARAVARGLDTAIAAVLDTRGLVPRWILPAELVRSYERNRTYMTDPYQLTTIEVRGQKFATGARYGEPLSSQLRTMIAFHDDARFVLLPIELRFEREAGGDAARGILRAALLDPRFAEAKWVGEVKGDAASVPAAALASVAARLADLFVEP